MQGLKAHKAVNNQLSVRGHHHVPQLITGFNKQKGSPANSLNKSLGNWKTRQPRQSEPHKPTIKQDKQSPTGSQNKHYNAITPPSKQGGEIDYKGMTLQQYFKAESSQQCKTQEDRLKQNDEANIQELNDGEDRLFGRLQINQTDEDRYNDQSSYCAETPDFTKQPSKPDENNYRQPKLLDKFTKITTKLRTQIDQQRDQSKLNPSNLTKNRLPSVLDHPTKALRGQQQLDSKRKRTISNTHEDRVSMRFTFNDFYKYDKESKNQRALQKVKVQRQRAAELRINELFLVTRYAQKFNINEAICRQIIKETKY